MLVSFCNRPEPGVGILDVDGERTVLDGVGHVTGLARHRDLLLAAVGAAEIWALRGDRVVWRASASPAGDVHSILVHDGALWAASTGTDQVMRFELRADGLGPGEPVWAASDARSDTHHVNGLAHHDGRVVASAFGPRAGERWSSAEAGYLVDVESGEVLVAPIYHPHSPTSTDGHLYWCESHTATLHGEAGALARLDGYTRGLVVRDGVALVGTSRGRSTSRSTGLVANPADEGLVVGRTALWRVQLDSAAVEQVADLGGYAEELFDVVA